ncbi:YdiK family protein [Salsuginibacillus kocurii]|uniref:YdiK family protein n=1 Tax=Salsuginibacillus kocurii TaxID=427078 RepID=UPI00037AACDF|nr:YdiK family protein [Salsuginibacillus kocurii]
MKLSPKTMGTLYMVLAVMFIFLAIQTTAVNGWNILSFLFAAFAAIDVMIAMRFYRSKPSNNDSNSSN